MGHLFASKSSLNRTGTFTMEETLTPARVAGWNSIAHGIERGIVENSMTGALDELD